jgi:LytS/YehU family sensor histidine kinase
VLFAGLLHYAEQQQHYLSQPFNWFWRHLRWLPLASTFFVIATYGTRHVVYWLLQQDYDHAPWLETWAYETLKILLLIGLWLGVLFGIYSFLMWRQQQQQLHTTQQALMQAKLAQLRSQLQPHFLFNTLNMISSYIHTDANKADRVLNQLADLLRASLDSSQTDLIPFDEELNVLQLYTDIMIQRFAPRAQLHWQIADDCRALLVPAFILQPLVENAFQHGLQSADASVHIMIRAERGENQWTIAVSNTGEWRATKQGIGLRNCRERLQTLFAEQAQLTHQQIGHDVQVSLTLPIQQRALT